MKWGRKASSPPTFRSSVITRVFPGTWFSKFKHINGSHDATTGKKQQRGKLDFSPANPSLPPRRREARFYSLDNDPYWTLSFRKDRGEGRRRIKPLWYDTEEEFQAAVSSLEGYGVARRELESIDEVVDTIQMEQGECSKKIVPKNGAFRKKSGRRSRKLRSRVQRKKKAEVVDDGEEGSSSAKEETEKSDGVKEEFQDSRNHQNLSSRNIYLSSNEEDCEDGRVLTDLAEESSDTSSARESNLKSQNLENKKFEENAVKTESQRESACLSRRLHSRKIKQNRKKAHVPRSECRIQALEDMKKARIKLKKEAGEQATESSTIYDSFAVVKSSFNPQQDFRDSMVEMIRVKGIRRREELEELLACYLTLNCDGHHDLIINAFQQVWFELSGGVH